MLLRIVTTLLAAAFFASAAYAGDPPAGVRNPVIFNAASNIPGQDEPPGLGILYTSSPSLGDADTIEDAFGNQNGGVEAPTFIFADSGTADSGNQVLGDGGETVDFIEWQTSATVEIHGYHLVLTNLDAFDRTAQLVRFLVDGVEEDFFDNDGASGASNAEVLDLPRPFAGPVTGSTFRIELTRTSNGPRLWEIDALTESYCGNGTVEGDEMCDDGNTVEGDGCQIDCTPDVVCGDGITTFPEQCDDGNTVSGDGCEADCTAICGDGIVTPTAGEECDDGNTVDCDGCPNSCQIEQRCGNGIVDLEGCTVPEECDDGNTIDDDACSNACLAALPEPLVGDLKLKIGLRFDKPLTDSIALAIKGLVLADGFSAAGANVQIDVGGAALDAPLDDKGRYKSADKRDSLKLKQKKKDGTWKLKLKRKKNDFANAFVDEGLLDEDNQEDKSATVPLSLDAGGSTFAADHDVTYRSKAGKNGKAKTNR